MRHNQSVAVDNDDDVVSLTEGHVFVDVYAIRVLVPFVCFMPSGIVVPQVDCFLTSRVPLRDLDVGIV